MADDTITEEIEDNATGPKKVTIGGESAEAHSLLDQIEADKYLASKRANASTNRGLNLRKIAPPGGI